MRGWLEEQKRRRLLLENLLTNYNEGRSMSFYCVAVALMPLDLIDKAISELKEKLAISQSDNSDMKAKAKALRGIIEGLAQEHGIELKLRKKTPTVTLSLNGMKGKGLRDSSPAAQNDTKRKTNLKLT